MKLRKFCPWLLADGGYVTEQGQRQDKDKPSTTPLLGAITPHTLTSVQSLTALSVTMSHVNVSKTGGTKNPKYLTRTGVQGGMENSY